MAQTLQESIKNERVRLEEERKAIGVQQRELEKRLADIDLERAAIAAYEITLSGKFAKPQKPAARHASSKRPASGGARRGSKTRRSSASLRRTPPASIGLRSSKRWA